MIDHCEIGKLLADTLIHGFPFLIVVKVVAGWLKYQGFIANRLMRQLAGLSQSRASRACPVTPTESFDAK